MSQELDDILELLNKDQLITLLNKRSIPIPPARKSNKVYREDLIRAYKNPLSIRDVLPEEMVNEIISRISVEDIHQLCRTDREFYYQCQDSKFWNKYLEGNRNKLRELITNLITNGQYSLVLLIWENLEQIGFERTEKIYKKILTLAANVNDKLAIKIWRLAPLNIRSQFHQDVIDKVNIFLKKYPLGPSMSGNWEEFLLLLNPYSDHPQFSSIPEAIIDNKELEYQWDNIKDLPLFSGECYQLCHSKIGNIYILQNSISMPFNDSVTRGYSRYVKKSVLDILTQMAYIVYDKRLLGPGLIFKIQIDDTAEYPTLLVHLI